MQKLSTELQIYSQAKASDKIIDSDPKKILEILSKGMILLGVKGERLPSDFELTYMVQMIRQDYPNLPIGEFQLAFELAAKDKLDENSETYQNFSVLYLSRLMSSYARWARSKSYEIPAPEEPKKIEAPQMTDDEIIEYSKDHYYRRKDWEHIYFALKTFKILYKRGLITDIEGTVKRTEDAIKAKYVYAMPREKKEMYRLLEDDEYMELQCRRKAVAEYFDNLLKLS